MKLTLKVELTGMEKEKCGHEKTVCSFSFIFGLISTVTRFVSQCPVDEKLSLATFRNANAMASPTCRSLELPL